MKLYIATTTLNFDSIVSTDSVSPAAFYQQRGFGITLFYDKASFILPNSILLTDAFPIFSINRSEVDHRPLVIEIDTLDYPPFFEAVKKNGDHIVYRTERTIYISPLTSKIYFFNEPDRRATLAKAESILESKYLLYVKLGAIKLYDRSIPSIKIGQDSFKKINDAPVPDSKYIIKDIGINKAKGFIVSYMIGAGMAITPESARLLRLSKDIKNGIYSIGTKEGKTDDAFSAVYRLANEAEELSSIIDPRKQEARERVLRYLSSVEASSMLRGASEEEIVLFLEKIGVYSTLFNQLNGGRLTSIVGLVQQALSSRDESLTESTLADISRYVSSITQRSSTVVNVPDLFKLGLDRNIIECYDSSLELESQKKVEIMFNLYSGYSYKAAGIRENRVDYITDAGIEFFPETNDGDQEDRNYINAMLDNIEHAASFDLMATDSQALQALAVFMRSPDADLDKMASLIVSNEIPDARIAFGLWGLFYGYSNIPQSYYNSLVQSLNNKEAASFVSQIHDALFGSTAPQNEKYAESQKEKSFWQKALSAVGFGAKEETPKEDQITSGVQGELWSGMDMDSEDGPTSEEANTPKESVKTAQEFSADSMTTEKEVPLEEDDLPGFDHVFQEIKDIIKTGFKKDQQVDYYSEAVKDICSSAQSYPAIKSHLDQIPILNGTSTNWDKAKRKIKNQVDSIARDEARLISERRYQSMMLEAAHGASRQFVIDEAAWEIVKNVLPEDEKIRKQLEKDLRWFQDNYNPKHVEKGGRTAYYGSYPRDNASVIANYERYLKQKREFNPRATWLQEIYLKVDTNAIIAALKQIYK